MAHKCTISGASRKTGNRVSHANNKTRHVFLANVQNKKVFLPELKRTVRLKVSTRILRTIDKIGLEATLRKYDMKLNDLLA